MKARACGNFVKYAPFYVNHSQFQSCLAQNQAAAKIIGLDQDSRSDIVSHQESLVHMFILEDIIMQLAMGQEVED